MTFETTQVIRLVAWICFFLYETYTTTRKDIKYYTEEYKKRLPYALQFPPIVFPIVWLVLKALLVTSHYLYYEYATDYNHWAFIAFTVCTLINNFINKGWSSLFWGMRRIGAALVGAILLVITAVLATVFLGLSEPVLGSLYWVPLVTYILYPCWLIVAMILNAFWYNGEPSNASGNLQQPLIRKRMQIP